MLKHVTRGERQMRTGLKLAAAALGLVVAGSAQAAQTFGGFSIDHVKLNSGIPGKDIYQFFARNLGTGDQAGTTRLQAVDIQLFADVTGTKDVSFHFTDLDGDGVNDANVLGQGLNIAATTDTGSYVRVGTFTPNPGDAGFDPQGRLSADPDSGQTVRNPETIFANRKSFRVVGLASPGALATNAQNGGRGAFFALAVVPTGSAPRLLGTVGAEAGSKQAIDYSVPEPTSLAVVGLAGAALLGRRRRQQV